jgi:UDP-N-acetylglucosamine 1-carboxyvinyltransferase
MIRNAASEPHVQDLCLMLNQMGADIQGIGSNVLTVHGVERLDGCTYHLHSDLTEVGSYLALAAVTGSELRIRKARPEHLRIIRLTFGKLGVQMEIEGPDVRVPGGQTLRVVDDLGGAIPKIDDGIWPNFPTDLMSAAVVTATQAHGTVLIHEKMFEGRLYFTDRLVAMGARIVLCDPHRAVISGPSSLHGEELYSPDIRAGMALLIAALCAEGVSTVYNVQQIDRGYERIEEKLQAVGARIKRVRD